jgi:hypothetical protein
VDRAAFGMLIARRDTVSVTPDSSHLLGECAESM